MNDLPRQKLSVLIKQEGSDIYKDRKRCKAFLLDYCGQYQREIFVLTKAIEQDVPQELAAYKQEPKMPFQALVMCLKNRLQDCYALTETAAVWAVESWAVALSVIPNQKSIQESQSTFEEQESVDPSSLYDLDNKYCYILFFSVLVGQVELVRKLIQSGVDLDVQDKEGRTPLIYSILANQQQVVKELVGAGASLDIIDDSGHNALHWAIMLGELEVVNLLVQAGADIWQPNKAGNRAWEIADNYKQQEIKETIKQVKD